MLLGDEGDGEAAHGPREPSLVFDEVERLPRRKGCEGAFASQCTTRTEDDCILENYTRSYM